MKTNKQKAVDILAGIVAILALTLLIAGMTYTTILPGYKGMVKHLKRSQ